MPVVAGSLVNYSLGLFFACLLATKTFSSHEEANKLLEYAKYLHSISRMPGIFYMLFKSVCSNLTQIEFIQN